ncbi:IclR family transcriptional regulator [Cellulosilyticum ruminicola]|uniref:IclR family transcriptional regulator n=1 Tax=Cellulosilyticum ruminicola TaxID=425254 RepID=UPI0006CFFDC6|nr:IclR family transcriptional regulator [Cellulosilyticum ruminicola]
MAKAILQTVDRALQLLEIVAEHPEGVMAKELEECMELNKVTVHRLLATLENRGFIERDGNGYTMGIKVVELSSMKLNNVELKTEATPYLRKLVKELGLPVQMAILEGQEAVFIDKVESLTSLRMYSQIGKRIPVYSSGVGKALLLQKTDEEILNLLSKIQFTQFTSKTLTSAEAVLEEIKQARITGYAVDHEEHEEGIVCIAAPIYDYRGEIIAAISAGGREGVFKGNWGQESIQIIKNTALEISKRLGYRG